MSYFLDWAYAAVSLTGQYLTGKKLWYGWPAQMLGQCLVGHISYQKGLYGMVALAVCLNVLYSWNLYKWWKGHE